MPAKRKKDFEQKVEDFGEEVGNIGRKFGDRMENRGKRFESHCHSTLGIIGPVVSSTIGIIVLAIAIWILGFINRESGIAIFGEISKFLLDYIGLFFAASLFFSYADYLEKIRPGAFAVFSPIVSAAGITFAFWILAHLLLIATNSLAIPALAGIALFVLAQKYLIFAFFLVVLYIAFLVKGPEKREETAKEEIFVKKKTEKKEAIRRLYRSGNEKLLGGVCGGIAEYFNIDPVIVRLLWIALCFAGGAGIILYIIAWIIIPRNPEHKWN